MNKEFENFKKIEKIGFLSYPRPDGFFGNDIDISCVFYPHAVWVHIVCKRFNICGGYDIFNKMGCTTLSAHEKEGVLKNHMNFCFREVTNDQEISAEEKLDQLQLSKEVLTFFEEVKENFRNKDTADFWTLIKSGFDEKDKEAIINLNIKYYYDDGRMQTDGYRELEIIAREIEAEELNTILNTALEPHRKNNDE